MKETGILFTPENYTKVLAGTKTMTRRIAKLTDSGRVKLAGSPKNWHLDDTDAIQAAPFGTVGDRLYCKESHYRYGRWMKNGFTKVGKQKWRLQCHPDMPTKFTLRSTDPRIQRADKETWGWQKRSPLFMPKSAARIWLELVNVRVERLQEISDDDKIAEGMDVDTCMRGRHDQWIELWDSINGKGAWERNEWVWVYRFRKV